MDKKGILQELINHYGEGKKVNFANKLGVPAQNVSAWFNRNTFDIELIYGKFPELSAHWLLTGEGNMFKRQIKTDCVQNNNIKQTECSVLEACEIEELPIIPGNIVNAPEIDVYQYITENENCIETAPVVQQFPDSKAFYRIKTKAMEPNICAGDMLALAAYPKGFERIVPGDPYSVDTNTNGLVTRLLYNHPDGFLARSYNPEKYPDFIITREEIINVFRIVGLLRINVQ